MSDVLQSSVIEPGSIKVLDRRSHYGVNVFELAPEAAQYTDRALLEWCGYTPQFGGEVQRTSERVCVRVYID